MCLNDTNKLTTMMAYEGRRLGTGVRSGKEIYFMYLFLLLGCFYHLHIFSKVKN